jgi:hypothetical protein
VLLAIAVVIGFQLPSPQLVERVQGRIESLRPALLAGGLAVVILLVGATVSSEGVPPFIYFRF